MSTEHHPLLDPAALDDLASQPIESVRSQRAACLDVETGLSYLRRMVQGSLDIVERETARRAGTDLPAAGDDLLDELPGILGDAPRPTGIGRLSATLEPTAFDDELTAEYDSLVQDGRLARVTDLDAAELTELADALRAIEVRVSERRRQFHDHIDVLQAELTRRYQTGEASVDSLLQER